MNKIHISLFRELGITLTYSYFIFYRNYSITNAVCFPQQHGAGISASRRAWERVFLHELHRTHKINHSIMKKTLIALMALVGVASAATTQSSLTLSEVNLGELLVLDISEAGLTTTTGFTIMLTLDFDSSTAGPAMWFSTMESTAADVGKTYSSSVATIGWGAPKDPKDYRLTLFTKGGSASNASTSADAISGSTPGDSSDFQTTAFVTYSAGTATLFEINSDGQLIQTGSTATYDATGTVNSLVLGNWDHTATNAEGKANITLYSGVLTQTEMQALIPEPTTATLSLLALAGLAARRRRK